MTWYDVTEKGLIGASYEFAQASSTSLVLYKEKIFVEKVQQQVCALFGIDPLISVGAGSLLIACKPAFTDGIIQHLEAGGIPIMSPDEYRNFELEKPVLERWSKYIDVAKIEQFKLLQ